MSHFPNSYDITSHSTYVDRTQVVFKKSQREIADLYRKHYSSVFTHAHDDRIIAALENGSHLDAPYTAAGVRNATIMHGSCTESLRAKGPNTDRQGPTLAAPSPQVNY